MAQRIHGRGRRPRHNARPCRALDRHPLLHTGGAAAGRNGRRTPQDEGSRTGGHTRMARLAVRPRRHSRGRRTVHQRRSGGGTSVQRDKHARPAEQALAGQAADTQDPRIHRRDGRDETVQDGKAEGLPRRDGLRRHTAVVPRRDSMDARHKGVRHRIQSPVHKLPPGGKGQGRVVCRQRRGAGRTELRDIQHTRIRRHKDKAVYGHSIPRRRDCGQAVRRSLDAELRPLFQPPLAGSGTRVQGKSRSTVESREEPLRNRGHAPHTHPGRRGHGKVPLLAGEEPGVRARGRRGGSRTETGRDPLRHTAPERRCRTTAPRPRTPPYCGRKGYTSTTPEDSSSTGRQT